MVDESCIGLRGLWKVGGSHTSRAAVAFTLKAQRNTFFCFPKYRPAVGEGRLGPAFWPPDELFVLPCGFGCESASPEAPRGCEGWRGECFGQSCTANGGDSAQGLLGLADDCGVLLLLLVMAIGFVRLLRVVGGC